MDWIKDITVEEVEALFADMSYEEDPTFYLSGFQKITHPIYGTYFTYETKLDDMSGNLLSERWYLGNFGGIFSERDWTNCALLDDESLICDFKFNREGVANRQPVTASRWLKLVAQKNKGVVDENGNDYHRAFVKAYVDSRERWYSEEVALLKNAINSFDKSFNDRFNGLARLTGYSINNGEEQQS